MLGLAGQHRVGQVDHGGPVLLPVHLVQQLAGARQVPARGGLQHASQYVEGVVSAVQAEQRAHAGLGQDQQRAGLLGQGRRAFVRLGGAAVGSRGQGHAGHALSTGGAALDRALQHLVGQLQGHDVAACVAQQVQQVGLVEEPRGRRGLDATADRLLGLVHVAQTEQGPGLGLGGLWLVRVEGQGQVGLLDRLFVVPALQVQPGQRVVDRVGEALSRGQGGGEACLQVLERGLEFTESRGRRCADPQRVGLAGLPLQHGGGQGDYGGPVIPPVGLVQQLDRLVEVAAARRGQRPADDLSRFLGSLQRVERAYAALGQGQDRLAMGAQVQGAGRGRREVQVLTREVAQHLADPVAQHRSVAGGLVDHARAEVQRGLVALGVAQQVEQVGWPQPQRCVHLLHARADPPFPAGLVAQGEHRAHLQLHALGLVRHDRQGCVRVLQHPGVVPLEQVHLGQGVVHGVGEAVEGLRGLGEAGLEVAQGPLAGAELGPGGAADPQAIGVVGFALEHGGRGVHHGAEVVVSMGLEQQLGHLLEVAAGGHGQTPTDQA